MSQNVLDSEDLELTEICTNKDCYGLDSDCYLCKGTGVIPTRFGRSILEFINEQLPIFLDRKREQKDG